MVAYVFYWIDELEKAHFIGILPEKRKNPERISQESIINLGRRILGNNADVNNIFFIQVTLDERTGEIFWPKPSIRTKEEV
jgi:hypothetical protein